MTANQIVNLVLRTVLRKLVSKGVNVGMNRAARLARPQPGAAPRGASQADRGSKRPDP